MALCSIYSVSIKLSYARRENARFIIKNPSLAKALFSSPPTHSQLFGGSSFSSQLEKAVKDSKIDLSWNRYQKKSSFHEGFQYSKGAGKYIVRNSQQRKQPNRNPPQELQLQQQQPPQGSKLFQTKRQKLLRLQEPSLISHNQPDSTSSTDNGKR